MRRNIPICNIMKVSLIKYRHHVPLGNIYHPEIVMKKPKPIKTIRLTEWEYTILQSISQYPYTIQELYPHLVTKKSIVSKAALSLQKKKLIFFKFEHNYGRWYLTPLGKNTIVGEIIDG